MAQLYFEQLLNGIQLGMFLFLVSSGLTLIFGFMNVINLAHGSLFMIGAYAIAFLHGVTNSFLLALILSLPVVAIFAWVIEVVIISRLYTRDHLDQVLATFALILFINEGTTMLFGRTPMFLDVPPLLSGMISIFGVVSYPLYRIAIIVAGLAVAFVLWIIIAKTRLGMLIRAGTTNRETVEQLGVNINQLNTIIFVAGAMFAGFAGMLAGPLTSVEVGMGENLLILCFVCIVIGGIGSIRGALLGAITVGVVDTMGRAFVPDLLGKFLEPTAASGISAGLSSMSIYLLMVVVLVVKPTGLFPVVKSH